MPADNSVEPELTPVDIFVAPTLATINGVSRRAEVAMEFFQGHPGCCGSNDTIRDFEVRVLSRSPEIPRHCPLERVPQGKTRKPRFAASATRELVPATERSSAKLMAAITNESSEISHG